MSNSLLDSALFSMIYFYCLGVSTALLHRIYIPLWLYFLVHVAGIQAVPDAFFESNNL